MNQIKKDEAEIIALLKSKQFATATGWLIVSVLLFVWPALQPDALLFIVLWTVIVAIALHTYTIQDITTVTQTPAPPTDIMSTVLAEIAALRAALAALTPAVNANTKATTDNTSITSAASGQALIAPPDKTTSIHAPQGSDSAKFQG